MDIWVVPHFSTKFERHSLCTFNGQMGAQTSRKSQNAFHICGKVVLIHFAVSFHIYYSLKCL